MQDLLRKNGFVSLLDYILYLSNISYQFTFIQCLQKEDRNKFILKYLELLEKKYKEEEFVALIDMKTKFSKCYLYEWIEIMNSLHLKYKYELYMLEKLFDYDSFGYNHGFLLYKSVGDYTMNSVITITDNELTLWSYMETIPRCNIYLTSTQNLTDKLSHKLIY